MQENYIDKQVNILAGELDPILDQYANDASTEIQSDQVLYHFTKYQGFIGIFRTGKLWHKNYELLKDKREINFSKEKISASIHEYAERSFVKDFWDHFLRQFNYITNDYMQVYTCSFCEVIDNEYLWEEYACHEYAIGFKQTVIKQVDDIDKDEHNRFITRITYNFENLKNPIEKILKRTDDFLSKKLSSRQFFNKEKNYLYNKVALLVFCYLSAFFPGLKEERYSDEKEVRTCLLYFQRGQEAVPKVPKERFIIDNGQVVRYEQPFVPYEVAEIWLGKKCPQDKNTIMNFLNQNGYQSQNIQIKNL